MTKIDDSFILIRDAVPDDMDELVSLLKNLFAIEQDFDFDQERHQKGLSMLLKNTKEACIIVAENTHTEKIVGMCTAQRLISTAEGGYAAMVEDVIVRKRFRRQGIAIKMLAALADWAQRNDVVRFQLLYDTSNPSALDFYKATGWQNTSLACLRRYITHAQTVHK